MNKYQEVNEVNKELVDRIYEVLEEVMDPELGIDIVNLGLIYEVEVDEEKTSIYKNDDDINGVSHGWSNYGRFENETIYELKGIDKYPN